MRAAVQGLMRGDVAVALSEAHAGDLYRRARAIDELARIVTECTRHGPRRDVARAERLMAQIAALAGGGGEA